MAELSKVNKRDHDRYWNNIENIIALPDRSSKSEKLFYTNTPRIEIQSIRIEIQSI